MIEGFNVKDVALGTGDTAAYTFDFKIYKTSHLLIYMLDDQGEVVDGYPIRGDDTEFLSGVTFDSIRGGGTVTFLADVPNEYSLIFLLAPDQPDQPTTFGDQTIFSLVTLGGALDYLGSLIQRVAYLAQRSIKLHDADDNDVPNGGFDPTLPKDIQDSANYGRGIFINEDGTAFMYGPTAAQVEAAEGYAEAASDSADAAAASAVLAAAQALGFYVTPQLAQPSGANGLTIDGLTALVLNNATRSEMQFIQGNAPINLLSGAEIENGQFVGKLLILIGCHAVNTVTLVNSPTLQLNGDCTLGLDDAIMLVWNGTYWSELFRRG